MFEVELKYHVTELASLRQCLRQLGASEQATEQHVDCYFNHPCRDFRQTNEALRIRRINDHPMITYKGPKDPGPVKVREELEWSLAPGDADGTLTQQLLTRLGFQAVATVQKTRRPFRLLQASAELTVTIDEVQNVGLFAEIEAIVDGRDAVEGAKSDVQRLAHRLGLRTIEQKSYLTLVLESMK